MTDFYFLFVYFYALNVFILPYCFGYTENKEIRRERAALSYPPFKFEEVARPTVVKNAAFCVMVKELDPVDSRLPKIVIL